MHRRRTQLARRINRVALSLERRGIVATYELQARLLANAAARRRFAGGEGALDERQQGIVDQLRSDGYSLLTFADLFPDPQVWWELEASRPVHHRHREGPSARGRRHERARAAAEAGQGVRHPALLLRGDARLRRPVAARGRQSEDAGHR